GIVPATAVSQDHDRARRGQRLSLRGRHHDVAEPGGHRLRGQPLRPARSEFDQWHAGERQPCDGDRTPSGRRDRLGRTEPGVSGRADAMIVDRRQSKPALLAALFAAASLTAYAAYAVLSPDGPRGGSWMGLFFASLGTGAIVFECLLGLRKRYPASPLGRVSTWVSAHVWLGLLSFLLILLHSGFHWGQGLAGLLMWLFAVILASGIFGVALQNYIPRRMTELVTRETVYEQIPSV